MFVLRLHASKEKKARKQTNYTKKKQENKLTTQLLSVLNPITY